MTKRVFIGIDLSGPANAKQTAVCWFDGHRLEIRSGCDDDFITSLVSKYVDADQVYISIDAPLSYQTNGGYRDVDRALRIFLNQQGFKKIGVMAPTMTRMAYLTLRGIRLYLLLSEYQNVSLFETHPGASLVVAGYPQNLVSNIKKSTAALNELNQLLFDDYLEVIQAKDDHQLMAFSAMMSSRRFARKDTLFSFQSMIPKQPLFIL